MSKRKAKMEMLIDMLVKEASRERYNKDDIRRYAKKRNKINSIAKKIGYKEKREHAKEGKEYDKDGRNTGIPGAPYCNLHDKINYCLKYSNNPYREQIKEASENFESLRDRILGGNIGLIVKEAKKYCRNNEDMGDFLQEGSAGLLHALSKYKPGLKIAFSTYATYWIRQYMRNSMENQAERTIRIPKHISESIGRLKKSLVRRKIQKDITDLSPGEIKHLIKVSDSRSDNIWHAIKIQKTTSLDHNLSEDLKIEDILGEWDKEHKEIWVKDALNSLDKADRRIIELRYLTSPDGKRGNYTLADVGKELKLTRERVRQREKRALKELHNYYKKHFPND